MKTILVVEDEFRIRKVICDYISNNQWGFIEASSGEEALEIFKEKAIDLVILDIKLPGISGLEVCKAMRTTSKVHIIFLTANSEERDYIKGYEVGGNDYMAKPFSNAILMAKIQAYFKTLERESHCLELGEISLNLDKKQLMVGPEEVHVTKNELALLEYFLNNKDIALTRESILNNVWGYDYEGTDRAVDNCIKRLRQKISPAPLPIKAIRGFGYKLEGLS